LNLPANSIGDLIEFAKRNPGRVTFGSQGIGTTPHLTSEMFALRTGTALAHVPYRGTAAAVNDLIAGHLDMLFMQLDAVHEHYRAGKLKMLAVMTERRISSLPEVPTIAEAGIVDLKSDTWNAIAAPPRTPKEIIAKINSAMNDALALPQVRDRLANLDMRVLGGSPEAMAEFVRTETRRWEEVIRKADITMN